MKKSQKFAHDPLSVAEHQKLEKEHESQGEYVGDMVYGALDGIVTTFAVVAGAAGANLAPGVVIVLGFANLIADGLSMAVGNYLSLKSEQDYYTAQRKMEEYEVEKFPKIEREEIRSIYASKGFAGKKLESLVDILTSNKKAWVDTMMAEELKLVFEKRDPVKAGGLTYLAFVIAGFIPVSIFVISVFFPMQKTILFQISFLLTFATIFAVGSLRSLVISKNWVAAGLEMLLIGGLTAVVSYFIGNFLGSLVL